MAKTNRTPKPKTTDKAAPKPRTRAAKKTPAPAPSSDAGELPAVSTAPSDSEPGTPQKNVPKSAALVKEIALRAYFLAQRRVQLGVSGSQESDWSEAERQVLSERAT